MLRMISRFVRPLVFATIVFGALANEATYGQSKYIEPRSLPDEQQEPLWGTKKLTLKGDIASQMIDGVDRFLLRKIDESVEKRERHWKRDFSSPEAYSKSVEPNRKRLAHILGVRDERVGFAAPEIVSTTDLPTVAAEGETYRIHYVRWPAFGDVHGRGVLLVPKDNEPIADVIVVRHGGEQGDLLSDDLTRKNNPFARHLATSGCRVLIVSVIQRSVEPGKKINLRELIYRSAFELGRGLLGYEVQKVLAALDWMHRDRSSTGAKPRKIGVAGWGDGGMIALYAAALDQRIDAALVSGYFDDRRNIWQEPIDRNVFGLLDQFSDAELASLIVPRRLIIETCAGPTATISGNGGGAPARLISPNISAVKQAVDRAKSLVAPLKTEAIDIVAGNDDMAASGSDEALKLLLGSLSQTASLEKEYKDPKHNWSGFLRVAGLFGREALHDFHELDRHNQQLLVESPYVRAEFMKKLDTSSVEAFEKSSEWYRDFFASEVIGRFDDPLLPANPRSRKAYETDKWTGYEVVLDVFPDVFAYGLLLIPKDLKDGERRPVVVCQHGLEGRPQDTIGPKGSGAYSAFTARLAERGFITFAPQNIYIFRDRFRTLQRKANPLGKTLFSIMVPQHQQITDWLKSLPFVDGERIAFYGLSYGGKSAMRIPPLVKNYCLSICSADFNEWVWKNASSRSPYSYADKGEYEIFEFDLGSTFNYAEMAALIAPRPFMVERGHFDTVAPDETVGYEFAKVRNLYNARLKLSPDRCQIEWFVGPHTINGVGTYEFLHHHLKWPK